MDDPPAPPLPLPDRVFHPFLQLPVELRLKIWRTYHKFTPPQLITLYLRKGLEPSDPPGNACETYSHIFLYLRPIPIILHINHEAREYGLHVYQAGFDVSQRLDSRGSWWTPDKALDGEEVNAYKSCVHEIGINDEKTRSFCYWDPNKDFVELVDSKLSMEMITERAAWIWSGRCDIRFSNIRWLAFTDVMAETWMAGSHNVSSSTVWTGMEAVFMVVSDFTKTRVAWTLMERIEEDKTRASKSGDDNVWVGRGHSLVPQVCMVGSKKRAEMMEFITKRIYAGKKSYKGPFATIY